eukprot:439494-Heterocapsa_arctica.AAC.1
MALRAVANLASKDRHRGSTKTKSSGMLPFSPALHSHYVQTSPRHDAEEAMAMRLRRHSAN